ncbi:MAG: hypothetical protein V1745_03500 [Patescibacteria group bacterium]
MAQQTYPTKGIKVFVGLGVVALVLMVVLSAVGAYYLAKQMEREGGVKRESLDAATTATEAPGLGGEGSACGGPMRLPCMPSLTCETTPDQDLGICIKSTEGTTSRVREAREACGPTMGRCVEKYTCKLSPGLETGVCVASTSSSPRVLTVRIKGMQQDQGWYLAEPGTTATVTVTVSNAATVAAYLTPKGTGTAVARTKLMDLTKAKDGSFSGTFTVQVGLLADLEIMARSVDGQESGMSVNVGTTE